ncbi:GTP pyrophosphokinase family protein, partial [Candidatus Saccharibacteria bacterium]|nr:GTP pyrophosphokinase family protein [Candidatus Saccharibacteria bacterium]
KHSGFVLSEERDYVKKPKESGSRGVHLIMGVAVATSNGTKMVTVEFQVRTTAMDEWCSKEHAMNYKNNQADAELEKWFRERAEEVWEADKKYEEYYQIIKGQTN